MTLASFKQALSKVDDLYFRLQSGEEVPMHFHITEIGSVQKRFIDCGGVVRDTSMVTFQLWYAGDVDHRLSSEKLLKIIGIAEQQLDINMDDEIEVEYQRDTIGRYGLTFDGFDFVLIPKMTDCLAQDKCGIPPNKLKIDIKDISSNNMKATNNACAPGSGCC